MKALYSRMLECIDFIMETSIKINFQGILFCLIYRLGSLIEEDWKCIEDILVTLVLSIHNVQSQFSFHFSNYFEDPMIDLLFHGIKGLDPMEMFTKILL